MIIYKLVVPISPKKKSVYVHDILMDIGYILGDYNGFMNKVVRGAFNLAPSGQIFIGPKHIPVQTQKKYTTHLIWIT